MASGFSYATKLQYSGRERFEFASSILVYKVIICAPLWTLHCTTTINNYVLVPYLIFLNVPESRPTFSSVPQARRRVGENSRLFVCHCWCADDRLTRACHCFQLQLLLSQGNRSRGNAISKFQPCSMLPLHAGAFRWVGRSVSGAWSPSILSTLANFKFAHVAPT